MIRIEFTLRNLVLFLLLLIAAWVTYLARDTVVLLGIALMLMATLHPLVELAERRGLSHSWAVAAVMLSLVLVPLLVIALLAPIIVAEVRSFAGSFPIVQRHADELLRHLGIADRVNQAIARANLQDRIADLAVVSAQETVTIVTKIFTIVVIAGYLLSDGRRLRLRLHQFVPRQSERHIEPLLAGMERVVGGYIRGQLLTSLLFGVFGYLLCLALRIPDPLLLGLVAAIGDVIPIFGIPAAMLLTMLVAFTSSVWQPLGVLAGYVLYGQLENHVLVPRIYARTVNLSPLVVIVATIMGATLYGIVGILIGIPTAGALKVIFDYIVAERVRGQQAAAATALNERTDAVGEKATAVGHGNPPLPAPPSTPAAPGVPAPSYSPFEEIPEQRPGPAEIREISGARYVTLAHVRAHRPHRPITQTGGRRRRRLGAVQDASQPTQERVRGAGGGDGTRPPALGEAAAGSRRRG